MTQGEIAAVCDVTPRTIREWMNEFDIPTRDLVGEDHPMHGRTRRPSVKRQISDALTGRSVSEETRERMARATKGTKISPEVRERIAEALRGRTLPEETRAKMSESTSGDRNPNWRGGYSRRYGAGWSVARRRALERDRVCRACGHDGSESRLEVHHLIPVRSVRLADDVPLSRAHSLENLVVLCRPCHRRADHGLLGFDPPAGLASDVEVSD